MVTAGPAYGLLTDEDHVPSTRSRPDRCPGLLRPWRAADGGLVRLRLVGGRLSVDQLRGLSAWAATYGDGDLHLTGRANLQVRGLRTTDGAVPDSAVAEVERLGLLPSRSHELVRNVMVSPQTGLAGGRVDLRPVATELDAGLRADPALARLSARFLFVLDDGRGDVIGRESDLALVALDGECCQLRAGADWAAPLRLGDAVDRLLALAADFATARGSAPDAPWHVRELDRKLVDPAPPDPRVPAPAAPLPYGTVPGGEHVAVPDGRLSPPLVATLTADLPGHHELVVTPWRGVLVPATGGTP